ncbi:hypothetical protein SSX86_014307 [Deinandra increscens subsp. villosa]|uniref:Phytosulfokine n=1 Tax=Deinandra increscens subsp. villosa TaxID=3103831 RepID=A0AAP0D995_9ASTR
MSRATIIFLALILALFCTLSTEARVVPAIPEAVTSTVSTATQKLAILFQFHLNSRTMSRATIVFLTLLLALFFMFSSSSEARLVPEALTSTVSATTQKGVQVVEDSCEGVGKEECLERRTLVAHLDYIYTNDKKP